MLVPHPISDSQKKKKKEVNDISSLQSSELIRWKTDWRVGLLSIAKSGIIISVSKKELILRDCKNTIRRRKIYTVAFFKDAISAKIECN